jgi:hypothetical protein
MAGNRRRRTTTRRRRSRRSRRSSGGSGKAILLIVLLLVVGTVLAGRLRDDAEPAEAPPADAPAPVTPSEAAEVLATLPVADESGEDAYQRAAFGEGWGDARNGCDVRDEVLAQESTEPVARGADGCSVRSGNWVSLYDRYQTPDPAELEVDHMVPLAEAWASGAAEWGPARRRAFANDMRRPDALIAVTAATNQSKSDRDPAEWMPPSRAAWCRYATAWITQKAAWELTVDRAERRALGNVLNGCPA